MLRVVFPGAAHSPGIPTGSRRRGWHRRSSRLVVALITIIAALAVAPVRPAAAAVDLDDWVWISTPDGKKCLGLDSRYDSRADMALVALRECDFAESLYWRRVEVWGSAAEFQNYYSGKCLDIAGASTAPKSS